MEAVLKMIRVGERQQQRCANGEFRRRDHERILQVVDRFRPIVLEQP
jgi:hypothetical protein